MPPDTEDLGLVALARSALRDLLHSDAAPGRGGAHSGHRGLMTAVRTAVVVLLLDDGAGHDGDSDDANETTARVRAVDRWLGRLEALQTGSGLFESGDNLQSPPDSAFTLNDVASTLALLRRTAQDGWAPAVAARLEEILRRALPALLTGGVHTPNHRWEIASALAATGRLLGEDAALDRARDWLGEGVDVDDDGLYSERSPNYAAHVSNPSLLTLADALPDPRLLGVVHRNLHATLDLSTPEGTTESCYSRRQDQREPTFPLSGFLPGLVRFAAECDRCARGARLAALGPQVDAVATLAGAVHDDRMRTGLRRAADVPALLEPESGERLFPSVSLWRRWHGQDWTVVSGGSDVPATGTVASGLASNPTFARLRRAGVELASLRLSRTFFGLGPFRAQGLRPVPAAENDDADLRRLELTEVLRAGYYQPLPPHVRRADAVYRLEHEGRFAAAMSFSSREVDELVLATTIRIDDAPQEVVVEIETAGTATWHALEIAVTQPVVVTGATPLGDGRYRVVDRVELRRPGSPAGLEILLDPQADPDLPIGYDPGERYTHLGGTDALGGLRLYVAWRSPGRQRLRVRTTR